MIDLYSSNALHLFDKVFDLSIPLVDRINNINKLDENGVHFMQYSLERPLPDSIKNALYSLFERSGYKKKLEL